MDINKLSTFAEIFYLKVILKRLSSYKILLSFLTIVSYFTLQQQVFAKTITFNHIQNSSIQNDGIHFLKSNSSAISLSANFVLISESENPEIELEQEIELCTKSIKPNFHLLQVSIVSNYYASNFTLVPHTQLYDLFCSWKLHINFLSF